MGSRRPPVRTPDDVRALVSVQVRSSLLLTKVSVSPVIFRLPSLSPQRHHLHVVVVEKGLVETSSEIHTQNEGNVTHGGRDPQLYTLTGDGVGTTDEIKIRLSLLAQMVKILKTQTLNVRRIAPSQHDGRRLSHKIL